jgi:hypothetical protein
LKVAFRGYTLRSNGVVAVGLLTLLGAGNGRLSVQGDPVRRLVGLVPGVLGLVLAVGGLEGTAAEAALPAAAPAAPGPGGSRSSGLDPGTLFRLTRPMDADGNLLVDSKELEDGFRKLAEDAAQVRSDLLAWLDTDKSGNLSPDEWRPFYTAMWMLSSIRSMDQNGDLVLQETEVAAAAKRMTDYCQGAKRYMLWQHDRDRDGKLSEAEVQAARQALRRFCPPLPAPAAALPEAGAAAPPGDGQ